MISIPTVVYTIKGFYLGTLFILLSCMGILKHTFNKKIYIYHKSCQKSMPFLVYICIYLLLNCATGSK